MSLQETYDDLSNIEDTLEVLIKEIQLEDWIICLKELLDEVRAERIEVETELEEQSNDEFKEMEHDYWNSQF
jgi:hypothetical protein